MLKRIPVNELIVDMYVAEIVEIPNRPMPKKKKGMIRDSRIISKFIEIGIKQVVIDTDKGLDLIDISSANDSNKAKIYFDAIIEEKLSELKDEAGKGAFAIAKDLQHYIKQNFGIVYNLSHVQLLCKKNFNYPLKKQD